MTPRLPGAPESVPAVFTIRGPTGEAETKTTFFTGAEDTP